MNTLNSKPLVHQVPRRAVCLTLKMDAHTSSELVSALQSLARQIDRGEISTGLIAGSDSSSIYELLSDPDKSPEDYFAELHAYLDSKQASDPAHAAPPATTALATTEPAPLLAGWTVGTNLSDGRRWLTIKAPCGSAASIGAAAATGNKHPTLAAQVVEYFVDTLNGRFGLPALPAAIPSEPTGEPMPWEPRSRDSSTKPTDTICALHFYYGVAHKLAPDWLPSRILLAKAVSGDFPIGHDTIAEAGEHDCQSNKWGALSVLAKNGKHLGIKPGEYTPIAWRRNEEATYG